MEDAFGCRGNGIFTVITCTLQLGAEVVDATTNGSSDGSISTDVTGGFPPYEYALNSLDYQPGNGVFEDLPAGNYIIRVRDSVGCDISLNVEINFTTGVSENYYGQVIELFPNPTDGFVRINVKGITDVQVMRIKIIDNNGKVVKQERLVAYDQMLTNKISLHQFPAGVYFIQFDHPDVKRLMKVVKE